MNNMAVGTVAGSLMYFPWFRRGIRAGASVDVQRIRDGHSLTGQADFYSYNATIQMQYITFDSSCHRPKLWFN